MTMNAGAWSETCLIEICPKGGSAVQLAAMTETVDIDMGDKDVEQVTTLKGGRVIKKIPQDITTITFEGYPMGISAVATAGDFGVSQFFHMTNAATYDATEPLAVNASIGRDLFRVCILWTEDMSLTMASAVTTAAKSAYRYTVANAYMTSMKPSFTDGVLKVTFSFKVAPFNKQGTAQIHEESTALTTAMPVLSTYDATRFPEDGTTFTWSA